MEEIKKKFSNVKLLIIGLIIAVSGISLEVIIAIIASFFRAK